MHPTHVHTINLKGLDPIAACSYIWQPNSKQNQYTQYAQQKQLLIMNANWMNQQILIPYCKLLLKTNNQVDKYTWWNRGMNSL